MSAHTHAEYRCTITTGRRHAADHQRVVVRPHPHRHHADHRRQVRRARRGRAPTNSIVRNSSNPRTSSSRRPAARPAEGPAGRRRRQQYVDRLGAARQPDHRQGPGQTSPEPAQRRSARSPSGDVIADAQLVATQPASLGRRPDRLHEPRRHPRRTSRSASSPVRRRGAGRGHLRRGLHHPALRQQPRHQDHDRRPDPPPARAAVRRAAAGQTTQRILQISRRFSYEPQRRPQPACADKVGRMLASTASPVDPADHLPRDDEQLPRHPAATGSRCSTRAPTPSAGPRTSTPWSPTSMLRERPGIAVPPLDRIVAKP